MSKITENTPISELLEMIGIKVEGEPTRATISLEVGCMPKMWVEFVEDGGLTVKTIDTTLDFKTSDDELENPVKPESNPSEFDPELKRKYKESCHAVIEQEGHCDDVACEECPAEDTHGFGCTWCDEDTAVAGAKQWLKDNGESE